MYGIKVITLSVDVDAPIAIFYKQNQIYNSSIIIFLN